MALYIGDTILKDPEDAEVYGIDWAAFIGANTIATSAWNVAVESGDDSGSGVTLTVDQDAIPTTTTTQSRINGGRPGVVYRVENKITFGSNPVQTKERSYYVAIKEQ